MAIGLSLGWIDARDFSFNSFLLMERFQIRGLFIWYAKNEDWRRHMGIALKAHPSVQWYFENRCPECVGTMRAILGESPSATDDGRIREAEIFALACAEDFVVYTHPEIMDKVCDFIYAWDPSRLFEMADFNGKTVLDVGSGSGRLAFAAAGKAKEVYASEPVGTLREFIRDKASRENIRNLRVLDGFIDSLPYPDRTFDIVMSGHVVGDDYDSELAEIARVCKTGGWLLDCPGDQCRSLKPNSELIRRGWEPMHYVGSVGGDVYRYRKQVIK